MARRAVNRVLGQRFDVESLRGYRQAVARADVVVLNETHLASSAQAAEHRLAGGPRLVTVCYENIPFRYEDAAHLAARKDVVRGATDRFVALTPEALDALLEEGVAKDRIVLQPYGVDARRFRAGHRSRDLRARWGVGDHDVAVLYTGRLLQEKGLVPLVRAAGRLADRRLTLVFVGAGPELPRLQRAATTLGVRLVHQPWVEPAEIPAVVASADVFALPSLPTPYWEEQLGYSAIEAMASSVPVLAVASGSIPFVVGAGGRYAPPYDVEALTAQLRALVSDPDLRGDVGARGRSRVEEHLDTAVIAPRLAAVCEEAMR